MLLTKAEQECQLKEYISTFDGAPKQDTNEWLRARKRTIGGSEMATIQGKGYFSSIPKLIAEKIGIIPRRRSIQMQWGKLFEPNICAYVETDFDTKILAQDLFIPGKFPTQSYSPDGLGVVELEFSYEHRGQKHTYHRWVTALFEFKTPYSRQVKDNGTIPDYYESQVKAGLDTIDLSEIGIYAEAMFRKCEWTDIGFNCLYDKSLTPRDTIRDASNVIAYGFVIFYGKYSTVPKHTNKQILNHQRLSNVLSDMGARPINCADIKDGCDFADIGGFPLETMEVVMDEYESKNIRGFYSSIFYRDKIVTNVGQEENWQGVYEHEENAKGSELRHAIWELSHNMHVMKEAGYDVYGVLPWKLFKIGYAFVDKEVGYLNQYKNTIDEIMSLVNLCNDNPENKTKYYNDYMQVDRDMERIEDDYDGYFKKGGALVTS